MKYTFGGVPLLASVASAADGVDQCRHAWPAVTLARETRMNSPRAEVTPSMRVSNEKFGVCCVEWFSKDGGSRWWVVIWSSWPCVGWVELKVWNIVDDVEDVSE